MTNATIRFDDWKYLLSIALNMKGQIFSVEPDHDSSYFRDNPPLYENDSDQPLPIIQGPTFSYLFQCIDISPTGHVLTAIRKEDVDHLPDDVLCRKKYIFFLEHYLTKPPTKKYGHKTTPRYRCDDAESFVMYTDLNWNRCPASIFGIVSVDRKRKRDDDGNKNQSRYEPGFTIDWSKTRSSDQCRQTILRNWIYFHNRNNSVAKKLSRNSMKTIEAYLVEFSNEWKHFYNEAMKTFATLFGKHRSEIAVKNYTCESTVSSYCDTSQCPIDLEAIQPMNKKGDSIQFLTLNHCDSASALLLPYQKIIKKYEDYNNAKRNKLIVEQKEELQKQHAEYLKRACKSLSSSTYQYLTSNNHSTIFEYLLYDVFGGSKVDRYEFIEAWLSENSNTNTDSIDETLQYFAIDGAPLQRSWFQKFKLLLSVELDFIHRNTLYKYISSNTVNETKRNQLILLNCIKKIHALFKPNEMLIELKYPKSNQHRNHQTILLCDNHHMILSFTHHFKNRPKKSKEIQLLLQETKAITLADHRFVIKQENENFQRWKRCLSTLSKFD